uniref:Uncharacterized protein n=1 Tax=Panagrolaimus davidi TaxID=227884 RepID=A0A914PVU4_9BILA
MVFPNRGQFYSTYRHQNFAFQGSIMYYIAKNPKSVKLYQKLVQSCKYFFRMNPILINEYICVLNYKSIGLKAVKEDGWKILDINNISSKCWITKGCYGFTGNNHHLVSSLIPKLYKCDAKRLDLGDQIITFDELMFLASNAEEIDLDGVVVKYEDGSLVPLEKVVEALPKIKTIRYSCTPSSPSVTGKTFKELMKIPHFMTLDYLKLWNVPEEFDLESFHIYMKKNERTEVKLKFGFPLSDEYIIRLYSIIDDIIATQNHDYKPPWIKFDGMDAETFDQLESIFYEL